MCTRMRTHAHSVRVSWVEHWPSLRTRAFIVRDLEVRTKERPAHVHWWRAAAGQELGPQILQGHELPEEDIPPIPYLWCDLENNLSARLVSTSSSAEGIPLFEVVIRFSTGMSSQRCLPCLCGGPWVLCRPPQDHVTSAATSWGPTELVVSVLSASSWLLFWLLTGWDESLTKLK